LGLNKVGSGEINSKSQIPNHKQITMTNPPSANQTNVLVIGNWKLRFICNLVLGIWDFKS
jgi:hypothetical protein